MARDRARDADESAARESMSCSAERASQQAGKVNGRERRRAERGARRRRGLTRRRRSKGCERVLQRRTAWRTGFELKVLRPLRFIVKM